MTAKSSDPAAPLISADDMARVRKSAKQVAAYANFLRWTANFRKDEVVTHANHDKVILLSPMQSGRFSFALEGRTLLLGVQSFEAAWISAMPFEAAYVSDRLYLSVEGVACMDSRMPPLALGLFVDEARKRHIMATAETIQPVRVLVRNGVVEEVEERIGEPIPIVEGDIIRKLFDTQQQKLRQQDMGRFF